MFYYPEPNLNPPEDTRRRVYRCAICGDDILEGDDYYDIYKLGPCCEACIEDSKCCEAELDYPVYEREED